MNIRLTQFCHGQLFGEEDAISNRNYTSTVRCISSTGVVLRVKKQDFIQKFGKFDQTWNVIIDRVQSKDMDTMQKLVINRRQSNIKSMPCSPKVKEALVRHESAETPIISQRVQNELRKTMGAP